MENYKISHYPFLDDKRESAVIPLPNSLSEGNVNEENHA